MHVAEHYVPGYPEAGYKVGFVARALGERIIVHGRHDRLEIRTRNAIEREERNCKGAWCLIISIRIC